MNGNDEGKKEWVAAMGGGLLAGLLSVHGAKGGGRASDRGRDGAGVFSLVLEAAAAAEVPPFSPRQAWLRGLEHGCSTCTPEGLNLRLPQPQWRAWCCCGSSECFSRHSGQIVVFGRTEAARRVLSQLFQLLPIHILSLSASHAGQLLVCFSSLFCFSAVTSHPSFVHSSSFNQTSSRLC